MQKLLIILLLVAFAGQSKTISMAMFRQKTEQYTFERRTRIGVNQIDTNANLYSMYAYMTLDAPFEKIAPYLLDFDAYETTFDHILDVHQVHDQYHPKDTFYYVEGKALFVHAWGIGKVNKLEYFPDSLINVQVGPVNNRLFLKYLRMNRGIVKYHTKKIHLEAQLHYLDEEHCRVALRGFSFTNKPVPKWMLSLMFHILLPGLMTDLVELALMEE